MNVSFFAFVFAGCFCIITATQFISNAFGFNYEPYVPVLTVVFWVALICAAISLIILIFKLDESDKSKHPFAPRCF